MVTMTDLLACSATLSSVPESWPTSTLISLYAGLG